MLVKRKGFSLIELMVVISIIGILMAVGAVSYTTAQRKGRDSSRKSDMRAVQQALEQYFTVNGGYPTTSDCGAVFATDEFAPAGRPTDPRPTQSYTFNCSSTGSEFCICAQLENESGNSDSPATSSDCDFDSSGNETYFCVTNQQ